MLDSPRIVECLDVVDDGRQQVGTCSSSWLFLFPPCFEEPLQPWVGFRVQMIVPEYLCNGTGCADGSSRPVVTAACLSLVCSRPVQVQVVIVPAF